LPTRDYSPPSGPATLAVVHHRLCCTRLPGSQKRGEKRNGIFLRPILVLQRDTSRVALGDASWYADPVDHHSGSTGGEYPASSWPQPMVDNSCVCAAGKSDRVMGVCVHPMAQPRLGRWLAGVSSRHPAVRRVRRLCRGLWKVTVICAGYVGSRAACLHRAALDASVPYCSTSEPDAETHGPRFSISRAIAR
jgi:hypothetical protein